MSVQISIHRRDLFSRRFFLDNDNRLPPLNISIIDWYLISSTNSNMSIISPSPTKFRNLFNSTTVTQSSSTSTTLPLTIADALPVALVLSSIVISCIFGNILVILSVFTFRPLRTVQNFFIVSLAFSDVLVATIVMPFHIVTHILKRWIFGREKRKQKPSLDKINKTFHFRTNLLPNFRHFGCSFMYFIDLKSLCYSSKRMIDKI